MKKEGSLGRRKNTYEKKKVSTGFLSGHPSSGLTRRVDQFTSSQLQARILNEIDTVNTIGSCWVSRLNVIRPGWATWLKFCWATVPDSIRSYWAAKPNNMGSTARPIFLGLVGQPDPLLLDMAVKPDPMLFDLAVQLNLAVIFD